MEPDITFICEIRIWAGPGLQIAFKCQQNLVVTFDRRACKQKRIRKNTVKLLGKQTRGFKNLQWVLLTRDSSSITNINFRLDDLLCLFESADDPQCALNRPPRTVAAVGVRFLPPKV